MPRERLNNEPILSFDLRSKEAVALGGLGLSKVHETFARAASDNTTERKSGNYWLGKLTELDSPLRQVHLESEILEAAEEIASWYEGSGMSRDRLLLILRVTIYLDRHLYRNFDA